MPARRESESNTAAGEIIDDRPFFSYANRVVKGQHNASGSNLYLPRGDSQGRAHYRWIRIKTSKIMKVTFWRPHRAKAVAVGKAGSLKEQPILIGADYRLVAREVEQTEVHWFSSRR